MMQVSVEDLALILMRKDVELLRLQRKLDAAVTALEKVTAQLEGMDAAAAPQPAAAAHADDTAAVAARIPVGNGVQRLG